MSLNNKKSFRIKLKTPKVWTERWGHVLVGFSKNSVVLYIILSTILCTTINSALLQSTEARGGQSSEKQTSGMCRGGFGLFSRVWGEERFQASDPETEVQRWSVARQDQRSPPTETTPNGRPDSWFCSGSEELKRTSIRFYRESVKQKHKKVWGEKGNPKSVAVLKILVCGY